MSIIALGHGMYAVMHGRKCVKTGTFCSCHDHIRSAVI